jgi:hypothetical protein
MKPVLIDVDDLRQPTKAPFLPYISRDRLERALRKLPKGKLQPKTPYLDFWPAAWDPDKLLIIPGTLLDLRRRGCRWVIRRVRSAGMTAWQIRYECSAPPSSSGTCDFIAVIPSIPELLECSNVQVTCHGVCRVRQVPNANGFGFSAQCQCDEI